jgi:transcriptional regulator with XRE-family HTH domain
VDSYKIGEKIKTLRQRKDLKQHELADKLSVANSTISNWETGRRLPSVTELKRISDFFEVSISFFDRSENYKLSVQSKSNDESNHFQQIIDFKSKCLSLEKRHIFLFSAMILSFTLSFLITSLVNILFMIIGFALLLFLVFAIYFENNQKQKTASKRILIPVSLAVFYRSKIDHKKLEVKNRYMHVISLMLIFLSILVYGLLILVLVQNETAVLYVTASFYTLGVLAMSLLRYRLLGQNIFYAHQIEYTNAHMYLRYSRLTWAFIVDLFGFVGFVSIYVFSNPMIERQILSYIILFLMMLLISLSSLFMIWHVKLVCSYQLYSKDLIEDGVLLST